MKKINLILAVAASAIVVFAACSKENAIPEKVQQEEAEAASGKVTLTATIDPATATVLAAGNKVEWVANDAISIFDGTTNIQSTTTDSGASASFSASLATAGPWYALYPYSAGASIAGSLVTTTLPAAQTAVAGSFADDLNISVALSEAGKLSFKNVLGLIKFTVGADADIVKVTLTGNNSEVLAGTVDIDYNSGNPTWAVNSGAASSVELTGTFVKGQTYYFAVLPQTFTNGITLTYTNSSDANRVETTANELVLGRSQIRNIGSPDIITFADPDVKAALVAHFDANSDGEISKAEAEAVTYNDFEAIVGNADIDATALWGADLTVINTFDELKYFTGLTNSSQSGRHQLPALFKGCTNLTSVKIPDNITHISNYSFADCSSLDGVVLPSGLTHIFSNCFNGCSLLASLEVPATLTAISSYAFKNCTSLAGIEGFGSTALTSLGTGLFAGCTSLATIAIPATVTSIGNNCFDGCTSLESFTVASGVKTIGNYAFRNCASLGKLPWGSSVQNAITSIGQYAFAGCVNMTLGTRNWQGVTTVGKAAFLNCKKVSNLTMNNASYQTIQDSTFFGCSALATIRVSNNLEIVRNHAFNGCVNLTTFSNTGTGNGFVLPPNVTRIMSYAFSDCRVLASANTPSGVPNFSNNSVLTRIDDRAFRYCAAFTEVELPASVTYLRRTFGTGTDSRAMQMTSLKLNSDAVISQGVDHPVFEDDWAAEDVPTIYVPAALVDEYKAADGWSVYAGKIVGF